MTMPGQILATLFQPGGSLGRRIRQQVLGLAPDPNPMRAGAAPALGQGGDIFAGMPGRGLALPNESNLPQKPYGLADVARANVYHAPADSNAGPARNKLRDAITALAYGLAGAEPGTDPGNNVLSGIARGYAGVDAYRHGQEQEAAAKLSQSGREELARQKQASDTDEAAARSDYYRAQAEALLRPREQAAAYHPIDPRSPEGIAADVQRALELRRRGLDRRAGDAGESPGQKRDVRNLGIIQRQIDDAQQDLASTETRTPTPRVRGRDDIMPADMAADSATGNAGIIAQDLAENRAFLADSLAREGQRRPYLTRAAGLRERADSLGRIRDSIAARVLGTDAPTTRPSPAPPSRDPAAHDAFTAAVQGLQEKRLQALQMGHSPAEVERAYNASVAQLGRQFGQVQR